MILTKNIERLPISLSTEQVAALAAAVTTRNAISDAVTAISGTPAHDGYVYVLWRVGRPELYVGSTLQSLRSRIQTHRVNTSTCPNRRVYKHINEHGGLVPAKTPRKLPIEPTEHAYGILPVAMCCVHGRRRANPELGALERAFTEMIEPVLNDNAVALTPEEYRQRKRESVRKSTKRRDAAKFTCACGGRTSEHNKPAHERTQMHQRWLATCHTVEE